MADLAIFAALVVVVGLVGAALGMLAARRIDAWGERRAAAADEGPVGPSAPAATGVETPEDGGETRA